MANEDTSKLLKETNAGIKMAVASIDDVLDKVKDEKLKDILIQSKQAHQTLGDETHKMILEINEKDKEPNPMAKAMSWLKTNTMMLVNNTDQEVASLMTKGCQMGIESLTKYLGKYEAAEEGAIQITKKLIRIEQNLENSLKSYL